MKSIKLIFAAFSFFFTLASNAQTEIKSESLEVFYTNTNQNKSGWPINGCHEFEVTVNLGLGEVSTSINHCCVNAVCAAESFWNILDAVLKNNNTSGEKIKNITILSSKSTVIGNYDVSIENGTYQLDKEGRPINLIYVGNKLK